jgi:hypothetical protein
MAKVAVPKYDFPEHSDAEHRVLPFFEILQQRRSAIINKRPPLAHSPLSEQHNVFEERCLLCNHAEDSGSLCVPCRRELPRLYGSAIESAKSAMCNLPDAKRCWKCEDPVFLNDSVIVDIDSYKLVKNAEEYEVPNTGLLCVRCYLQQIHSMEDDPKPLDDEVDFEIKPSVTSYEKAMCALPVVTTTCQRCGARRPTSALIYADQSRIMCGHCALETDTHDPDTLCIISE